MVFRRKRRSRRRRRRRKRGSYAKKLQVRRPRGFLFGNSKVVKLKYVHIGQIPLTALGNPSHLSFRCNSIFDPDVALGGGQPRGYDQLAPLYHRYCVTASKITVRFMPEGVNAPGDHHPLVLYVQQTNQLVPLLFSPRDALESRHVNARAWSAGQGAIGCTLKKSFNCKKWFTTVDPLDGHLYNSIMANNPLHPVFWHISFTPTHGGSTLSPCDVLIQIDYTVVLTQQINPPAS